MTEIAERQIVKPVSLKFMLGDLRLFSLEYETLVIDPHGLNRAYNAEPPGPPPQAPCDVVLLRSCPVSGPLPRFCWSRGWIRYVPSQYQRYYIDLSSTFDEYMAKFSAKSRATLIRKVRKFAQTFGAVDPPVRVYRHPAELREFHRLAREVSRRSYQERLLDAGLPAPDGFRERLADLARRDAVRAYLLFAGDRPVAYLCCPANDGALIYQYVGFDPEFRAYSPGTVLQHLALESIFAEREFSYFDFTEGEGAHKQFFSTGSVSCADVYYFRRSVSKTCMIASHLATNALSETAGRILDRLNLKTAIRRRMRLQQ